MHPKDIDWNDLRYVLVLAQHQSMVASAEALRVHQTTISRRIVSLEEQLGERLFDRIEGRFVPTARGLLLVHRAEEMQAAHRALDGDLHHDTSQGRALVRLSVIQTFVTGFLARHLALFPQCFPDIQLELLCENRPGVIERRESDIAIRYERPAQGQALVRKLATLGSSAYAHRALLETGGDWRRELPWIGFAQVSDRWPEFGWMHAHVPAQRVTLSVNGGPAYTQLVAQGFGAGILTCIEGDAREHLVRLSGDEPLIMREVWMLVLPEMRRNPTVRRVLDWLVGVIEQDGTALHGGRAPVASGA